MADGTHTTAPARATLQDLADQQGFDLYESMPPPQTVFRLGCIPLASLCHHDGLTVQVFLDDPPGYYLAMRDAYRAGLLPPIVVTDSEIIDGYHRIVLALADKSPTIAAYQPEPCRSLAACAGTAGEAHVTGAVPVLGGACGGSRRVLPAVGQPCSSPVGGWLRVGLAARRLAAGSSP